MSAETYERFESDDNEQLLGELFANLSSLQDELDQGESVEAIEDALTVIVGGLRSVIDEKPVFVQSQYMLLPDSDNMNFMSEEVSVARGSLQGQIVSLSVLSCPDTSGYARPTIGLKLHAGQIEIDTKLSHGKIDYYAFCPIDQSIFTVDIETPTLMPEANDDFAEAIDVSILNDPKDFAALASLFQDVGDNLSDLQRSMYLDYLNKVATFESVVALAPIGLCFRDDEVYGYNPDNLYLLEASSPYFKLIAFSAEDESEIYKLVLCGRDKDGDEMGLMVEDIVDIQLR